MIFFSSDREFETFYKAFAANGLKIDLLVTESPKKQGRNMQVKPNPAHEFADQNGLPVKTFEKLDDRALKEIKKFISDDKLGFIFAYGKIIPKPIIDIFENGILNIHFSLLPQYPGASPIQQALLDNQDKTGYTVFEITEKLDLGMILVQKEVDIAPDDNFDTLRTRIIDQAASELPATIKKYLAWEVTLRKMPEIKSAYTHRISKSAGLITDQDTAQSAYNKIRAFSRWPKTFLMAGDKRLIIHSAKLTDDQLEILKIQPEGKKIMDYKEFANGYSELLTKIPPFVKIN